MLDLSRANRGPLSQWWWTIDHWVLGLLLILMSIGVLLLMAASPAVADHHKWTSFYFIKRHLSLLLPSVILTLGVSLLSLKQMRRFAFVLFVFSIFLLIMTLFFGVDIKGARRWLMIGGFSFQASEFVKPSLIVLCSWMISEQEKNQQFPGKWISTGLCGMVILLLLGQPDLGMAILVLLVWFAQLFIMGLPLLWVLCAGLAGCGGFLGAYYIFPHVARRVDHFLFPEEGGRFGSRFQVSQSLEAFSQGGLFGKGPGEGVIKKYLPDAHADFIFAVAGEEFGFLLCFFILLLYGGIFFRCLMRLLQEKNFFITLSVTGLTLQFGIQALVNIASNLNIIPPKGMTLPFLSYGGSSLLALSVGMGMLLGLTRRRIEERGFS